MIDVLREMAEAQEHAAKQAAAAESANVITVRVERVAGEYMLHVHTNHPALINFEGDLDEIGYLLSGSVVHSLTGTCPCNMTPIEDLAADGITELVIGRDGGDQLVIQIPQPETMH